MTYTVTVGDETRTYDLDTSTLTRVIAGVTVEQRPFTPAEAGWAATHLAGVARDTQTAQIRATLGAGIDALTTAMTQAQADVTVATTARNAALADKVPAAALKAQADSLAATGSTAEVRAVAAAISQLAGWRGSVDQSIADLQGWRAAVDANAVTTDQDLIYLARLAGWAGQ